MSKKKKKAKKQESGVITMPHVHLSVQLDDATRVPDPRIEDAVKKGDPEKTARGHVVINREKVAKTAHVSCWESHPKLPITVGSKTYLVTGGSCTQCKTLGNGDYDVVVGLDYSMHTDKMAYPWEKGEYFLYEIKDMNPPSNVGTFKELIKYLAKAVLDDKRVFVGCIGGHGRTGVVLSALHAHMTGAKDSVKYVRDNYCQKAVETSSQMEFLHKHFGIKKESGSKVYSGSMMGGYGKDSWHGNNTWDSYYGTSTGGTASVAKEQILRHMSNHNCLTKGLDKIRI